MSKSKIYNHNIPIILIKHHMKSIKRFFFILLICDIIFCLTMSSCKKEMYTVPKLVTGEITAIKYVSAVCSSTIISDGGKMISERGVCWSTSQMPTIVDNKTLDSTSASSYTSLIDGLSYNTTYYVRAFAINSIGVSYGDQVIFTSNNPGLPTVSTNSVSYITATSAVCGGDVIYSGGEGISIIARGLCWGTNLNPTFADNFTSNGSGLGTFSQTIDVLTHNVTYHVRAYAINGADTAFGNDVNFTTAVNYAIGDSYQGGKIAYIFQYGDPGFISGETHGLITPINDQSNGIRWYNGSYIVTGAIGTALGTGNSNSSIIISNQGVGSYAAKLCYDLTIGGYTDWYLPSKDELNKLYLNKSIIGGFANADYWSSSEYNSTQAWGQSFINGYQGYGGTKNSSYNVRAVRSF
jgi:hypothetical protein